jgi:hypothetical protein
LGLHSGGLRLAGQIARYELASEHMTDYPRQQTNTVAGQGKTVKVPGETENRVPGHFDSDRQLDFFLANIRSAGKQGSGGVSFIRRRLS